VAASTFEGLIQLVADRGPADYGAGNVGHSESIGNPAVSDVDAQALVVKGLQVGAPVHARLEAEAEGEFFPGHDVKRAAEGRLVVAPEWPELKRPVS
jgi:hypothetical protein